MKLHLAGSILYFPAYCISHSPVIRTVRCLKQNFRSDFVDSCYCTLPYCYCYERAHFRGKRV